MSFFDFFISDALAVGGQEEQSFITGMIPLFIIFILFWFLLIRPQTKRAKEHKQLVAALSKGDEVLVNGGLVGKITEVEESFVSMEIADNVIVKMQRSAITTIMPKGTLKAKANTGKKNNKKKKDKDSDKQDDGDDTNNNDKALSKKE